MPFLYCGYKCKLTVTKAYLYPFWMHKSPLWLLWVGAGVAVPTLRAKWTHVSSQ